MPSPVEPPAAHLLLAQPRVWAVTAVHNHLALTQSLMASLRAQQPPLAGIVVVDDGSSDGTPAWLAAQADVRTLTGDGTLWWTGSLVWAVNAVLQMAAPHDFVLTINNDCTCGPEYVAALVAASLAHGRAVVGSVVVDKVDGQRVSEAGLWLEWRRYRFHNHPPPTLAMLQAGAQVLPPCNCLPTKGTLFPLEVFRQHGNFDATGWPHYLSDIEFSHRLWRAHVPLMVASTAVLHNNLARTGVGNQVPEHLTYRQVWDLLWSRRSSLNVVDHWRFIRRHGPLRHQPYALLTQGGKVLTLLSRTWPWWRLRGPRLDR